MYGCEGRGEVVCVRSEFGGSASRGFVMYYILVG